MWPQKWYASAFCARSAAPRTPVPLTASRSFPARARKPRREVVETTASLSTHGPGRVGEDALELEERVERPLRERLAVGRGHHSVGAPRDREVTPGLGVLLLVEHLELDLRVGCDEPERRLERVAERAAGRAEDCKQERRLRAKALDELESRAELGPFVIDRERGLGSERQPQLADLPREREQRDGEDCHGREREHEP